jgi:antitoxin HigA-1
MPRIPTHAPPIHPGEMLLEEFLKPLAISQSRLARDIGVPFQRVNELVRGERAMTIDTALRLERYLDMPAAFWMDLQSTWDLYAAKHAPSAKEIQKIRKYA